MFIPLPYNGCGGCDGKEHSQDRKEGAPENCRERQTLPVRQVPQEKRKTCQITSPLVLPELPEYRKGIPVSFVKCSVDGCSRKLQPILKVDPRDRETWFYRECDVCLKPACEKHSGEVEGQIICDRCRGEAEAQQQSAGLIDLGSRLRPEQE
jgi:hypothetical protein